MRDNGQLSAEIRADVLEQMIDEWERQQFAAEMSVRVADRIGDERMRAQAVAQLTRAEAALEVLGEELERITEAVVSG